MSIKEILSGTIKEILSRHEFNLFGIEHVYYNFSKSDTLFISFAGAVPIYVSSTWFYKEKNFFHCLFLKNDPIYNSYNDDNYGKIIMHYVNKFKIKKFVTYGPSMGGMASIYWGLKLNNANLKLLGVVAIDLRVKNFDINIVLDLIKNMNINPIIYLNYTFPDIKKKEKRPSGIDPIISEFQKKNCLLMLQPTESSKHLEFIPSKSYLKYLVKIIENWKISNHFSSKAWI